MESLIKDGTIIKIHPSDRASVLPYYAIQCNNTRLHLTVKLSGQKIVIHQDDLMARTEISNLCRTMLQPMKEYGLKPSNSYYDYPDWVFGFAFYDSVCLSYNYAKNTLGIGHPVAR
jgi:hypothetical protein